MHADSLLWKRDLLTRSDRGHIELPRLIEGHYALQVFSSVTKSPNGQNYHSNGADSDSITNLAIIDLQPPRTWTSLLERSLWHAEKLRSFAERSDGRLRLIGSPSDIDRLLADRRNGDSVVGGMLSIEGLQDLEGNIANLDVLYAAGFRMAGLAHFFDNDVAGSMRGVGKGGLTALGHQVVRRMEALVEFRGEPARTRVQPHCQDQVPDEINLSCRGSETALPRASRFLFGRFHPGSAFAKYVRTTRVLGDQGHRNGIC
jgi:microsomal dipeptidase-like Zn-dependent dipeptidase